MRHNALRDLHQRANWIRQSDSLKCKVCTFVDAQSETRRPWDYICSAEMGAFPSVELLIAVLNMIPLYDSPLFSIGGQYS